MSTHSSLAAARISTLDRLGEALRADMAATPKPAPIRRPALTDAQVAANLAAGAEAAARRSAETAAWIAEESARLRAHVAAAILQHGYDAALIALLGEIQIDPWMTTEEIVMKDAKLRAMHDSLGVAFARQPVARAA